jgi:hypothetical protein
VKTGYNVWILVSELRCVVDRSLQKVSNHMQDHTESCPRRQQSICSSPWKPQISDGNKSVSCKEAHGQPSNSCHLRLRALLSAEARLLGLLVVRAAEARLLGLLVVRAAEGSCLVYRLMYKNVRWWNDNVYIAVWTTLFVFKHHVLTSSPVA